MTQIQHVSEKEMTRRTGFHNALGYTFPRKDLILLRKGLTGKRKREVLNHESAHLKNNEEGPFLDPGTSALIGGGLSLAGGMIGSSGADKARQQQWEMFQQTQRQLAPYRKFGGEELASLKNWLAGPTGAFQPISTEDVLASPEYQTAMTSMQNQMAAMGGLQSGNALRRVLQEVAPTGVSALQNKRYQELAQRLGLVNVGQSAAAGSAGITASMAPGMAAAAAAPYQAWQGALGDVSGFLGQYAGQRQWQDFIDQYKNPGINPYASP